MPDPSLYSLGSQSSSASATYVPSAAGQQFHTGTSASSTSQPQPGPSGMRGPLLWSGRTKSGPRLSRHKRGSFESTAALSFPMGLNLSMSAGSRAGQDNSPKKVLICDFCNAAMTTSHGLEKHIDHFHLKKFRFKCDLCDKGFTVKDHYEDHLNMHRNIRVHKCPYCSICFAFKSGLRRHLRKAVCSKYKKTIG